MKVMALRTSFLLLILAVIALHTQPDMPRAVVNGKNMTLADVEPLVGKLPAELQKSPEMVFRTYGFMDLMAAKGEEEKLDQLSPYKEQLDLARKQLLADAAMQHYYNTLDISDDEIKSYYDKHPDDYTTASVSSLLVPLKSKEDQAAAIEKARDCAKALKDGTNLATLFAQYPGNLTSIRQNDPAVDKAARDAVFALKPGETSSPVVTAAGVYVFRLDSVSKAGYDNVKPNVRKVIADERLNAFLDDMRKKVTVTMVKKP